MRLIKQTILYFKDSRSDKVYEVDLCEVGAEQFLVNFRYGRRGSVLREGTKTDLPVNQAAAEIIYDKLVAGKTKKGYRETLEAAADFIPSQIDLPKEEEPIVKTSDTFTLPSEHKEAFLSLLKSYVHPDISQKTAPKPNVPNQPPPPPRLQPNPKSDSLWGMLKQWVGGDQPQGREHRTRSSSHSTSTNQKKNRPIDRLSRLVWRSGELRVQEALPLLLEVAIGKNPMTDYSLAWALGKLENDRAIGRLAELETRALATKNNGLYRIVREAQMACSSPEGQAALAQKTLSAFPAALATAIRSKNADAFGEELNKALKNNDLPNIIADLYLISNAHLFVREALVEWAINVPLEGGGYFRGVRQLFKSAEFREDAEVVGLLAYRFQTTQGNFDNTKYAGRYVNGRYLRISEEIGKPSSQFAYSKSTKEYFTRRCARTLKRKGDIGDPSYVKMAVGMLLPIKDGDAGKVFSKTFYKYINVDGQWTSERRTLHYSAFSKLSVFNEILFKNSSRFSVTGNGKWIYAEGQNPETPAPTAREEAYPELWDKMPTGVLHLLAESQCREVHEFAVKAARANHRSVLSFADTDFIKLLFGKPYDVTKQYAIDLAKSKYDPQNPDAELVIVMLESDLETARTVALEWMGANKTFFLNDAPFLANLLFVHHEEVVAWVFDYISDVVKNDEKSLAVIGRVLALIMGQDEQATELEKKRILVAGEHLTHHFTKPLSKINLNLVNDLLGHPLPEVQVLGAKILRNHEVLVKDLPEDLLLGLINGPSAELREVGVELLGQLSVEDLVKKEDLLLGLCLSQYPEIRQAVKPVVTNLANGSKGFAAAFVQRLAPWLLRREDNEGRDADLLDLLTVHLKSHLAAIGKDTTLNLLFAPRKAAHQLGSYLLHHHIEATDLTIRQIVKLGDNEMLAVRQWVWDFYKKNMARVKYEAPNAVRLLDSKWDDSRDFAIQFFRNDFSENDWTPDILVSLCDSVNPMVQQLGKELISKFFKQEDGEQYLLQLSQHPAAELQQFATNYLDNFAADKPQNIHELKPYFITVLSSINKSRVAKKRVFEFLKQEGIKSQTVAEIVADVMARQSVTMAIGDKAACIEIMRDLQLLYPEMKLPLQVVEFETYPTNV